MPAAEAAPVTAAETNSLFADLAESGGLLLAVSGGPDSTALLFLAARWRKTLKKKPKLLAVTVDHALRKESKREAADVARIARRLGVSHRIVRWNGKKPATGLQQAARQARYRLLGEEAKKSGASHILTAHTLDDQAETVLIRMARGSGMSGLAAMARRSPRDGLTLLRPFLDLSKARLVATLRKAKIKFADDPSNRDPRFTRARLRDLMPELAREGLDARRLAQLARRLRRANAAIEAAVKRAETELALADATEGTAAFDAPSFARLPAEIALRLLGRAITRLGNEGPVELGKLEALAAALAGAAAGQKAAGNAFRRTLAGAIVTWDGPRLTVEPAPPRRGASKIAAKSVSGTGRKSSRDAALTTRPRGKGVRAKAR